MSKVVFITHPEVEIDPLVPIERWSLSRTGITRIQKMLALEWVSSVKSIHSSTEKKALDGASIIADHLKLTVALHEQLGENDRSSTGYLPREEFESVADLFFANPAESVRGWETALDAQSRIVLETEKIIQANPTDQSIAIVSHGAVGALLLCHLSGWQIDRKHDQPGGGGGNYFCFDQSTQKVIHGWRPIDAEPA